MTLVEQLTRSFPGESIPVALSKLAEYAEGVTDRISCDFELTASGDEDLLAWFRGRPEAAKQFWVFGKDGMHSLYGYWIYEGRTIANAPIVYLNGEGSDNTVMANTLEEFIALLTLGEESVGLFDAWGQSQRPCDGIEEFRAWAKTEFGIEPPKNAREVVEQARRSHPDLDEWIDREVIPFLDV